MNGLNKSKQTLTIKAIALFEGGKGLLSLILATLFIFVYHANPHELAVSLINDFKANPNGYYPHLILMISSTFKGGQIFAFVSCMYLYSAIKLSEAYGLWRNRQWGRTLGILSIGVLIPFEIYESIHHFSYSKVAILILNTAIVVILFKYFPKKH